MDVVIVEFKDANVACTVVLIFEFFYGFLCRQYKRDIEGEEFENNCLHSMLSGINHRVSSQDAEQLTYYKILADHCRIG